MTKSNELDTNVATAQGWKYESNGVDGYWTPLYEWITPDGKRLFRSDFDEAYQPSSNWKHTGWLLEKYNVKIAHTHGTHVATCEDYESTGDTVQEAICLAVIGYLRGRQNES